MLAALSAARLLVPLVEREAGELADTGPGAGPENLADTLQPCWPFERLPPGTRPPGECLPTWNTITLWDTITRDTITRGHDHPGHDHPGHGACAASKEMAFPTLIGRDGRPALLAFTSLDALIRWRPDARPVPAPAAQVWGTATGSQCAVVIDVAGPVPLAVDGARLHALANGEPPPAPQDDPDVRPRSPTSSPPSPPLSARGWPGEPKAPTSPSASSSTPAIRHRRCRAWPRRSRPGSPGGCAGGSSCRRCPPGRRHARMTSWPGAVIAAAAGLLIGGYVTVLIGGSPRRGRSPAPRRADPAPAGGVPALRRRARRRGIVPLLGWARTGGACRHCGEA